ncbi:MAG: hotdog fold thioesterase [Pseudohongiellaceae bacterium]
MALWKTPATPDNINERLTNGMAGNLGIIFTEVGEDYLKATMPLNNLTSQHMGFIHGGANVVLAETIANIGSILCCEEGKTVIGLDINANHIRPGKSTITAIAKPLHIGRSTMVWEVKIYDKDNKLTCVSRFTGAVIPKPEEL